MELHEGEHHKKHRKKQAGVKADRRELRKKSKNLANNGGGSAEKKHNPKAFTFSGGVVSVQRRVQRAMDKTAAKEKIVKIDKTPDIPPPYTVVFQGPPGVGKSTLIRCLAKHFSKQPVPKINGNVTVVASKRRRLTFVECPNDVSAMLDLAKVADLCLLLIDAQYGFEMETFEFINMLQTHGFPRVIGVLTHLDKFEDNKTVRKRKKELKARFWSELYDGAKLFYLAGMMHGKYLRRDILNLSRYISVQNFQPLQWRTAHPYVLALRYDTGLDGNHDPDGKAFNSSDKGSCFFYGYVRGAVLRNNQWVHIAGAGDFQIDELTVCEDPCPHPGAESDMNVGSNGNDTFLKKKKTRASRVLSDRQRCIFAPYSDIGNVTVDEDSMYINVSNIKNGFTPKALLLKKDSGKKRDENESASTKDGYESDDVDKSDRESSGSDHEDDSKTFSASSSDDEDEASESEKEEDLTDAVRMVRDLQRGSEVMCKQIQQQQLRLLPTSKVTVSDTHELVEAKVTPFSSRRKCDNVLSDSEGSSDESSQLNDESDRFLSDESDGDGIYLNQDSTEGMECSKALKSRSFEQIGIGVLMQKNPFKMGPALADLVYGCKNVSDRTVDAEVDRSCKEKRKGTIPLFDDEEDDDDETCANIGEVSDKGFLYGNLSIVSNMLNGNYKRGNLDDEPYGEAEMYCALGVEEFDDSKAIEAFWSSQMISAIKKAFFVTGGFEREQAFGDGENVRQETSTGVGYENAEAVTPEAVFKHAEKTNHGTMLVGGDTGGTNAGVFVRIRVNGLPFQWLQTLNPNKPIVIGGLNAGELQLTFMQVRLKKHRWYPRILKSNDPLLFSAGWRRFQALPMYAIEDRGESRTRFLKYTPEHLHCFAYIYAPILPPSTPVLAIRDTRAVPNYRITAIGTVLEASNEPYVVKKLKLIGEPKKIFKNTAFIRGMFNTDLEASRCIGARIQTASGIRGQIKKALGNDGTFRATFEDKILMSDLVICKAWIRVMAKDFYNPVVDVSCWRRLRTQAEIRNALEIPHPKTDDNLLGTGDVERPVRKFNPIKIPKKLAVDLPFHSQIKQKLPTSKLKKSLSKAEKREELELRNPLTSSYEKRIRVLLHRLRTITKARHEQRKEKQKKKMAEKATQMRKIEAGRENKQKEIRKKRYVKQGKVELAMRKKMKLSGGNEDMD